MGKSSRTKGARGEREVRDILRQNGFQCERDGRLDTDLKHDCDGIHWEVKRAETTKIHEWMRQAASECNGQIPIVAHRKNNEHWLATLPLTDLVILLATIRDK